MAPLRQGHLSGCATPSHCTGLRPRIFWYPSPLPPWTREANFRWRFLQRLLRTSAHHTADGDCADYYVISNHARDGQPTSANVVEMFRYLGMRWPYWNRSIQWNVSRHLMLTPCEHGPGDCGYDRRTRSLDEKLDPASPQRLLGFLTPNGAPGKFNYFVHGVDLRLPQDEQHECGPFCGVKRTARLRHGQTILRRFSPWAVTDPVAREQALQQRRKIRFFWAGHSAGAKGFRGGLVAKHLNRTGFLVHDSSPSGRKRRRSTTHLYPELNASMGDEWLARAMASSDFCYSPLGQRCVSAKPANDPCAVCATRPPPRPKDGLLCVQTWGQRPLSPRDSLRMRPRLCQREGGGAIPRGHRLDTDLTEAGAKACANNVQGYRQLQSRSHCRDAAGNG